MNLHAELNPEQREAVVHGDGPLLILAGAGSGKTRVITHRIAHLIRECGVDPYRILAVTFTNKAAGEMKERVESLVDGTRGIWISTFHAFGARVLRKHADCLAWGKDFVIYDADDSKRLGKLILRELDLDPDQYRVEKLLQQVERAKHRLQGPDSLKRHFQLGARFYARYQKKLQQANAFDFADLIFQTHQLFARFPEVLAEYRDRFLHVMVDEFQDTDRAQYSLLRMICSAEANLCVVGDDDQSIYMWRDADVANIMGFHRDFPSAQVVKLERNYRSSANILDAAARVIAANRDRHKKRLWTEDEPGEAVVLERYDNEHEEAEQVAREIHQARQQGQKLSEFAIFYRMNAQSRALEEAFRLYGLPYLVVGSTRFFDRREIKDMMAYLRLLHNPKSDMDLLRVINVPARGIGKLTQERLLQAAAQADRPVFEILRAEHLGKLRSAESKKVLAFRTLIDELRARIGALDVDEVVALAVDRSGYLDWLHNDGDPAAEARQENLRELITAASDFSGMSGDASMGGFLEHVALVTAVDLDEAGSDRVSMMTLHAAKGLEFDCVFMVGLEEGLLPHYRVLQPDQEDPRYGERKVSSYAGVEEERRICYVGITRARKKLCLSYVRSRTLFGRTQENPPSRFLDVLAQSCQPASPPTTTPAWTWDQRPKAKAVAVDQVEVDLDDEDELVVDYSEDFDQSQEPLSRPEQEEQWMGLWVAHVSYGRGRVCATSTSQMGLKLVIDFGGLGKKTILAKFVRPER